MSLAVASLSGEFSLIAAGSAILFAATQPALLAASKRAALGSRNREALVWAALPAWIVCGFVRMWNDSRG